MVGRVRGSECQRDALSKRVASGLCGVTRRRGSRAWCDGSACPALRTTLTDDIRVMRDVIEVDPLSPSRPNIPLSALSELNRDSTWLDVDFAEGVP